MKLKTLFLILLALTVSGCGGCRSQLPQGQRQAFFADDARVSGKLGGMLRGRVAFKEEAFVAGAPS